MRWPRNGRTVARTKLLHESKHGMRPNVFCPKRRLHHYLLHY
ncbi:hypothetical protein Goarm_008027 [Gossypium armourianum]|uniref:Uncharacterized protein n=1 Tax=Gossypium armourianum TaxID=34283 RepID=A0A7J9JNJ6_9ROSI|nr:hypothetical protein [Gossypium armourianum]